MAVQQTGHRNMTFSGSTTYFDIFEQKTRNKKKYGFQKNRYDEIKYYINGWLPKNPEETLKKEELLILINEIEKQPTASGLLKHPNKELIISKLREMIDND